MTILLLLIPAAMLLLYTLERLVMPTVSCWRCAGVGQLQRWHRLTWKPCPRCAGTGTRPRWGTR